MRKTAVALRGDLRSASGAGGAAPVVEATGHGFTAEEIIALAERHGVPVEHDPVLAGALSQLRVGEVIPPELYQAVAELLVFLYDLDARQTETLEPLVRREPIAPRLGSRLSMEDNRAAG